MEEDTKMTLKNAKQLTPTAAASQDIVPVPTNIKVHANAMIKQCLQNPQNHRLAEIFKIDTTISFSLPHVLEMVSAFLNQELQKGLGESIPRALACLKIFENILKNESLHPIYVSKNLHLIITAVTNCVVHRSIKPELSYLTSDWLHLKEYAVNVLVSLTIKYPAFESTFGFQLNLRMLKLFFRGLSLNINYLPAAYGCLKGLWAIMVKPVFPVLNNIMMKLEYSLLQRRQIDPFAAAKLQALIQVSRLSILNI